MKKALKIIAITLGCFMLIFIAGLFVLIKNLPSAWQVKQAISPRAPQSLPSQTRTEEARVDEGKALSRKALQEDFLNDRQPLSSACAHLAQAPESRFLRDDENASSKEFLKKLTAETKDPLIESAAPVFRYVFRLRQMRDLIDMVEQAQAEPANDFLNKTKFYAQIALVANDVRANKHNIDRLLMKTYNLYSLAKAVAKHPELAQDPATLGFCQRLEKSINLAMDYDVDQQAQELQKFLASAKVDAQEIGYNPEYRSDVQVQRKDHSLVIQNVWMEKLFAEDLRKAEKQLSKALSPPLPPSDSEY